MMVMGELLTCCSVVGEVARPLSTSIRTCELCICSVCQVDKEFRVDTIVVSNAERNCREETVKERRFNLCNE